MPGCGGRHTGRTVHANDRYRFVTEPAEGGPVPSRATRPRPTPAATARTGRSKEAQAKAPVPRPPVDGLVVGFVPMVARAAGVLLALAGALDIAAVFPTYLVIGGREIAQVVRCGQPAGGARRPGAEPGGGGSAGARRRPQVRAGLCRGRGGAGHRAVADRAVLRGTASTSRPAVEVIAGVRVLTSTVSVGAGWVLGVLSLCAVLAAGVCAFLGPGTARSWRTADSWTPPGRRWPAEH